jgi:hypothetical protein
MKSWLIGGICTAVIVAGCLLAYPGAPGRHLAGLTLMTAGVSGVAELVRGRAKP